MAALVFVLVVVGAVTIGYLFTTLMCLLAVWAYNMIAVNDVNLNIWALGLLMFIISWFVSSIFKK